jgi:bacterioferritin
MKGNGKLLKTLNGLLADELTATNQYIVHTEMAGNWGYHKLHQFIRNRSIAEMKHAETLIERILFLEGRPIVSNLNDIHIGAEVSGQLANDLASEMMAIEHYNNAIKYARDINDNATREILEGILKEEDGHVNDIEARLDQIKQMGVEHFLSIQAEE